VRTSPRPGRAALLVAVTLSLTVACTADADGDPQDAGVPAFAGVPCPAEVSTLVVSEVTCGYLTVPESRTEQGRTIRLFVTRVPPPEGASEAEPVFVAGTDLGDVPNISGIAPMAQRTGREVIVLEPRGVGRSEPTLDCREVQEVAPLTLATATDDPSTRQRYLGAVAACYDRLTQAGIDVSAYGIGEMAADAEDLRRALGIESWNVATFGTSSRIALEMLRTAPDHLRGVLLDSPEWPGLDPRTAAARSTDEAFAAVFDACAQDPVCQAAYPVGVDALTAALTRLETAPVVVTVDDQSGDGGVEVRFDAAMLLQALRSALAGDSVGGLYSAEAVPSVVAAVLAGGTEELSTLAAALVGDDAYCNGYHPRCSSDGRGAGAVDLTILCRDIAPFSGPGAPVVGAERAGFAAAFSRSPYLDVCSSWPVDPGPAEVGEQVRSDVPVLVMAGAFDPYVRPGAARAGLRGLSSLTFLVDPAGGHNVMPRTDCMLGVRQAWLDDPTRVVSADCLQTVRPDWP